MGKREMPVDVADVMRVAREAGQLVMRMRAEGLQAIRSKSSAIDLVTEADVASEKYIRQALEVLAPEIGFWGEESDEPPQGDLFWVVDPIDGTNNYATGIPYFAVNIALQQGDNPLLGVTLELPAQRLYWACAGEGAFLQEAEGVKSAIAVNDVDRLDEAFLITGFPYHRAEHADNNSSEFAHLLVRARGLRCMGASAVDLASVARGIVSGYWEAWLKPWDAAAGALIVREAGGLVTDYAGNPWRLNAQSLVASNGQPALHDALLAEIRSARATLAESRLLY